MWVVDGVWKLWLQDSCVYFSSPELSLEFKTLHIESPIPHLLLDSFYGDLKFNTSKNQAQARATFPQVLPCLSFSPKLQGPFFCLCNLFPEATQLSWLITSSSKSILSTANHPPTISSLTSYYHLPPPLRGESQTHIESQTHTGRHTL